MRTPLAVLAVTALSCAATAGVEGVYETQGGPPLTVKVQDDNHVRLETGGPGYQLLVDGELFMVVDQGGGPPMVMSADTMKRQMERFAGKKEPSKDHGGKVDFEFSDTGRQEEVAGIEGDVYEARAKGADGRKRTMEVVLSDDERLMELQAGFLAVLKGTAMMGNPAADQSTMLFDRIADATSGKGLLRAEGLTLRSLERKEFPAGTFELPENAQSMDMGGQ